MYEINFDTSPLFNCCYSHSPTLFDESISKETSDEYIFILILSELAIISPANLVYYIRANLHEKCKNDATFQKSF